MQQWESDPAYKAVVRAFVDGDPQDQAGGPLDVRAVVAAIRPEAKDGFLVNEVPWDRFPEGREVRKRMERLRSGSIAAIRGALDALGGLCANDMRAAVAPAVPFLVRIGTDPSTGMRTEALGVTAAAARVGYLGVCTRDRMLRPRGADEWLYEPTGYLANWSVQAARDAIAADADLLLRLVDDPSPAVRIAALYALAAASDRARDIRTAFHTRLLTEPSPAVRSALILAMAELTRAHPAPETVGWIRDQWSTPSRSPEVRVSAALGWMCLSDQPIPDRLRAMVNDLATDDMAELMAPLPWMRAAECADGDGLPRCMRAMLHPDAPDTGDGQDDPWS
ncbi:HEAT repeat domain-containing protein [Streptomyces mesophilus]|uniref:HEAT repeat domain-containing protein n=1 Tax=Streptomyces mesophilus TaxID=1775132 RepID=UPI00332EFE1B